MPTAIAFNTYLFLMFTVRFEVFEHPVKVKVMYQVL
jgi:hypothetical protein